MMHQVDSRAIVRSSRRVLLARAVAALSLAGLASGPLVRDSEAARNGKRGGRQHNRTQNKRSEKSVSSPGQPGEPGKPGEVSGID